jgi:hypothetical protein
MASKSRTLAADTEAGVQHAALADVTASAPSVAAAINFPIIFAMSRTFLPHNMIGFWHARSQQMVSGLGGREINIISRRKTARTKNQAWPLSLDSKRESIP